MKRSTCRRYSAIALGLLAVFSVTGSYAQQLQGPPVACTTGLIGNPGTFEVFDAVLGAVATYSSTGSCLMCPPPTSLAQAIDSSVAPGNGVIIGTGAMGGGFNHVASLAVTSTNTSFFAGRRVGFMIQAVTPTLLTLDLLRATTLTTSKNGIIQQTFQGPNPLSPANLGTGALPSNSTLALDVTTLALIPVSQFYISARTSRDFDTVTINYGGLLRIMSQIRVNGACVSR